jgi:hypothetical protein
MKPCPFCGSTRTKTHHEVKSGAWRAYGYCQDCLARGPEMSGRMWDGKWSTTHQQIHCVALEEWDRREG